MKRGDLITVAISGDYRKPARARYQVGFSGRSRQRARLPADDDATRSTLYRLALPANEATGLREASQVMVDKIMAIRRDRCSVPIGRANDAALLALGRLIAFVVGIAD